jgi:hypothetical protein
MTGDLFGARFGGRPLIPAADVEPGAIFSPDRKRRYVLARQVGAGERVACFVMLNPSRADEERNDLTVAKCCEFARTWQCGYVVVVNLVPWISTDPLGLYLLREHDVISDREENKRYVVQAAHAAVKSGGPVVCAWGAHGHYLDQDLLVLRWLEDAKCAAQCLGTTVEGYPRHPGRIAYATALEPYPTAGHLEQLARRVKR